MSDAKRLELFHRAALRFSSSSFWQAASLTKPFAVSASSKAALPLTTRGEGHLTISLLTAWAVAHGACTG